MKNFKTKMVETLKGNFKIAFIDTTQCHPTWFSHEDEKIVREKSWHVGENDLVFDVGAAYGSYTLTALLQGATKTYSWSPEGGSGDANERDFLEKSLELNNWQHKGTVYGYGFFDKNGWLDTVAKKFYDVYPDIVENPNYFIEVKILNDWYKDVFLKTDDPKKYNKIWMKIDVEGAEIEVLNGALDLINDLKPIICIENHLFIRNTIVDEVKSILLPLGYKEISHDPYHSVSHSVYIHQSKL